MFHNRIGGLKAFLLTCLAATFGCTQGTLQKPDLSASPSASHEVKYVTLTVENFEKEVLQSEVPVLVDFWATWCGPCMRIGPDIEALAVEYEGKAKVGKINVDEQEALAVKYKAEEIPLLLVFKDGKVVKEQKGVSAANARAELKKLLDDVL